MAPCCYGPGNICRKGSEIYGGITTVLRTYAGCVESYILVGGHASSDRADAEGLARVNAETTQRLALKAPNEHTDTGTQTPSDGRESLRERLRRLWRGGQ